MGRSWMQDSKGAAYYDLDDFLEAKDAEERKNNDEMRVSTRHLAKVGLDNLKKDGWQVTQTNSEGVTLKRPKRK